MPVKDENTRIMITFPKAALNVLDQLVARSKECRSRSELLLICFDYFLINELGANKETKKGEN